VDNPSRFTAETARLFLKREGIKIDGKIRFGQRPKNARMIGRKTSRTAGDIVSDVNKTSNNMMAEMLLRSIGVQKAGVGDWNESRRIVTELLRDKFGLKDFIYGNGSGLFGDSAFSARDMVIVLRHMTRLNPALPEFEASLPISGVDGTLKKRLRDIKRGAVRAKTGTLDGVICLSGYLYAKDGSRMVFSILTNDVNAKGWQVKKIQDRILRVVGGYPSP
jgi:D-alanyl-D-alanine carboxypeptidase/D-alanyl-D-alanine-endopeptidase (penicillin-binding protein 4)